jgi:hypothetical protein
MKKSERQPYQILEEASRDISGNERGSVDDGKGVDLLSQFGPDKKDINRFTGRFTGGRKSCE